jgi:hypothetical protein
VRRNELLDRLDNAGFEIATSFETLAGSWSQGAYSLNNAADAQEERRSLPRFPLQLPVEVRSAGVVGPLTTVTRDVSASGLYVYMEEGLKVGDFIEFTMVLPPELTQTTDIHVFCKAKVLRVEPSQGNRIGVAATISHYEFLPDTDS